MPKQIAFILLVLLPVFCFSQVKEVIIPPSKDTARIRFTTTTVTTTEYKVDYLSTAPGNKPPIASAGQDVAITLPTNTVTLSAISSTDADGTITSYKWEKVNGGSATLNQVNTALNASGLTQGVYVFRVTVTDNGGLSDNDEVQVTVNPAPTNPPNTGVRQNVIFESLFDGSNPFDASKLYKQACCSYSITQSKSIVRSGDGSFRAEVRGGDPESSGGYRAELITSAPALKEAWYGYSVYFENWSACSSCGEHAPQLHPANSSGSAVFGVYTDKNTWHVRLNPEGDESAFTLKNTLPIKSNVWHDVVLHFIWDRTAGRIEMWINSEKYVDYTGATLTMSGLPYWKTGINRWNIKGVNRVLYFDNVRIGNANATYKDVAP